MATKPKVKIAEMARYLPKDSTGIAIRRNPKNNFAVVELDYIADPVKRDPIWIATERSRMNPKQWAVEMERSWETYAGKSVYDKAFFKHLHVAKAPFGANPNFPIFRGWDFGGNQSVAICQIIEGRLYVLDELPNAGTNTREFTPRVISYCNQQFGEDYHYIDVVDPSGMWDTGRAEGRSNVDVMRDFGLTPYAAPSNDPHKRIDAVIELLMRLHSDGQPCLLINPSCSMIIRGFEGGYHYPEKSTKSRKADQPVKNLFSHIADALQYVAIRMKAHKNKVKDDDDLAYERSLTMTNYRFGK